RSGTTSLITTCRLKTVTSHSKPCVENDNQRMITEASVAAMILLAQNFEQRGYLETSGAFYPQTAPNDSGQAAGYGILRWEPSYKFPPWLKLSASFDAQIDSHRQVERAWRLDADDRSILRPAFSLRRLSATLHKGKFTVELGRQFIRWGKADILN